HRRALMANATPRPLYVRRQVKNWRAIAEWAKRQGFATTLGSAMHVTIAFSRAAVDWMKVSESWAAELTVAAGGPRVVEALGDKGAVVLMFKASELEWRHQAIREAGASWDWPEYQPHVTITYAPPEGLDLEAVIPFPGAIELGPEIFEVLNDDWT